MTMKNKIVSLIIYTGRQTRLMLPPGARVIGGCVGRSDEDTALLWFIGGNFTQQIEDRREAFWFGCFETGEYIPNDMEHVITIFPSGCGGGKIWHVFRRKDKKDNDTI